MNIFETTLSQLEATGNLRKIPCASIDFKLDLSSNDYLGLASDWKKFLPEFLEKFPEAGFSSSASRLLSRRQDFFFELESVLDSLYKKKTLLFNSGYHANVGLISALAQISSTLFVCDKLVHASVIDGLKMADANFKRFPHNDIEALCKILGKESHHYSTLIIVAESVYSMEGDTVPLHEITKLKKIYPGVKIYLDEAHAFGVRGTRGLGFAEESGLIDDVDFLIGTFGKAAASTGAFVAAEENAVNYFVNKSRALIFSTALPPVNVAWSLFMIDKIINMREERLYLKEISEVINSFIEEITNKKNPSESQIFPLVTGDSFQALNISKRMREDYGIIGMPIRRPTVPPGKECVRLSLSASLTRKEIEYLKLALIHILNS